MSREPSFTDERRSSSAAVQALAASLRSFFGPDKAAKCIVEEGASAAPTIAGCTLDFLQSVRIRHPAFSYAMEVVDGQMRAAGGGVTGLLVLSGLLLQRLDRLLHEGLPRPMLVRLLPPAFQLCEQVMQAAAVALPALALLTPPEATATYHQQLRCLLWRSLDETAAGYPGSPNGPGKANGGSIAGGTTAQGDAAANDAVAAANDAARARRTASTAAAVVARQGGDDDFDWFFCDGDAAQGQGSLQQGCGAALAGTTANEGAVCRPEAPRDDLTETASADKEAGESRSQLERSLAAAREPATGDSPGSSSGSGNSSSSHQTPLPPLSPWRHAVCAAALALEHGASAEMRLAAAAMLQLLPDDDSGYGGTPVTSSNINACGAAPTTPALPMPLPVWEQNVLVQSRLGPTAAGSRVLPGVAVQLGADAATRAYDAVSARLTATAAGGASGGSPSLLSKSSRWASDPTACFSAVVLQGGWPEAPPADDGAAAATTTVVRSASELQQLAASSSSDRHASALAAALSRLGADLLLAGGAVDEVVTRALQESNGALVLSGLGVRAARSCAGLLGVPCAGDLTLASPQEHVARRTRLTLASFGPGGAVDSDVVAAPRAQAGKQVPLARQTVVALVQPGNEDGNDDDDDDAGGASHHASPTSPSPSVISAVPSRRVTLMLCCPVAAQLETVETRVKGCFARLVAALRGASGSSSIGAGSRGSGSSSSAVATLLPGGGAAELLCAVALRRKADAALAAATATAADEGSTALKQAAWARFNASLRTDLLLYEPLVLQALAECFEELVAVLLENTGAGGGGGGNGGGSGDVGSDGSCGEDGRSRAASPYCSTLLYADALQLLAARGRPAAEECFDLVAGDDCGGLPPLARERGLLSVAAAASGSSNAGRDRGSNSQQQQQQQQQFVADCLAARRHGLTACCDLVCALLSTDCVITNHAVNTKS